jgi:hypothetical protein
MESLPRRSLEVCQLLVRGLSRHPLQELLVVVKGQCHLSVHLLGGAGKASMGCPSSSIHNDACSPACIGHAPRHAAAWQRAPALWAATHRVLKLRHVMLQWQLLPSCIPSTALRPAAWKLPRSCGS